MWHSRMYIKERCRRPVRRTCPMGLWDVQGAIPAAWCDRCGAEVFWPGGELCSRCRRKEQSNEEL